MEVTPGFGDDPLRSQLSGNFLVRHCQRLAAQTRMKILTGTLPTDGDGTAMRMARNAVRDNLCTADGFADPYGDEDSTLYTYHRELHPFASRRVLTCAGFVAMVSTIAFMIGADRAIHELEDLVGTGQDIITQTTLQMPGEDALRNNAPLIKYEEYVFVHPEERIGFSPPEATQNPDR